MDIYAIIGLVGLAVTIVVQCALSFFLPDIVPAIFTAPWWYQAVPYSVVWIVFLVVGLATGNRKANAKEDTAEDWRAGPNTA